MDLLTSDRLIIKNFTKEDFLDVLSLAVNWKSAPGPEFDKWPVDENGCKNFLEYLCTHENYYSVYFCDKKRIIGLLAINNIDKDKKLDLGHVIHSDFQNNDIDREALKMMVNHIFNTMDVKTITTGNYPNEKQIAPLIDLGFIKSEENDGIYDMEKINWKNG